MVGVPFCIGHFGLSIEIHIEFVCDLSVTQVMRILTCSVDRLFICIEVQFLSSGVGLRSFTFRLSIAWSFKFSFDPSWFVFLALRPLKISLAACITFMFLVGLPYCSVIFLLHTSVTELVRGTPCSESSGQRSCSNGVISECSANLSYADGKFSREGNLQSNWCTHNNLQISRLLYGYSIMKD